MWTNDSTCGRVELRRPSELRSITKNVWRPESPPFSRLQAAHQMTVYIVAKIQMAAPNRALFSFVWDPVTTKTSYT